MKRQELVKYQNATADEINKAITSLNRELVDARMQLQMGELKDVHQTQKIRHDLARLKTILNNQIITGNTPKSEVKSPTRSKKASPSQEIDKKNKLNKKE